MSDDDEGEAPPEQGRNKRKRQQTNEDNSIDSDDYDMCLEKLRAEQRKIDSRVRARENHDLRQKVRRDLWTPYFTASKDALNAANVESWAWSIKARLDAVRQLGDKARRGDKFQRTLGAAMANETALKCDDLIGMFEQEFGLEFSSAIVPLSDEGYVLWVFNSNDDNDETIHNYALGVRTCLTGACKAEVIKELRDPEESSEYGKLCEVLPRIWLLPNQDTGTFMRMATFQATRCSFENALVFRDKARVSVMDYCFVPVSLCELHQVTLL